ncbi:MAG: NADH:ubiquinone reductase (Na(+)-transporting) subunit C [Planctomycetota bacterium]|nr:NADH:ubiquinone reductase (Na(+)-transporting) subunit C [Planctomycetota bacterium]
MDKNSNSFTIMFAVVVCFVLAVGLAATYSSLETKIEANMSFDKQKNILVAVGLYDPDEDVDKTRAQIEASYERYMSDKVLEVVRKMVKIPVKSGGTTSEIEREEVVDLIDTPHDYADLADLQREESKKPEAERKELVSLHVRVDDQGEAVAYCIPISGYGLWGTLYGFLALKADCDQVQGITFYKHKETPGLGGEVDNRKWQLQWQSKKVRDAKGRLVSVTVKKGKVDDGVEIERLHQVDGLAGATITCNGVTNFVRKDLATYETYFQSIRSKRK